MPRIDNFLERTAWGDLHEATRKYVKNNLIDAVKTYEFNQDNEYLEEIGVACEHLVILKNGLVIQAASISVWGCNTDGGVYIKFNDDAYFEPY